jgi:hypothetical protein
MPPRVLSDGHEQGDSDQTLIITPINPDHWTLNTAAQRLKVSVITVRRKLQKGQLEGYKVEGINGPEWRIIPPDQTLIVEQGTHDQPLLTTPVSPEHLVVEVLLTRLSDVESQLASAQKELQGAVWRNGYLGCF